MKKLLFILLISPMFIWAQKTHKVGPKETLFSIGRLYNVHPRELADYNKIPFENGVKIGQVIKIPTQKTMAPLTDAVAPTTTEPVKPPVVTKPVTPAPVKAPVVTKPIPANVPVKDAIVKQPEKVTEKPAVNSGMVAIYHKVQKKENLFQIKTKYNNVSIDDIKKWNKLTTDAVNEGMNLIVGYQKKSNEVVVNKEPAKTVAVVSVPVKEIKVEPTIAVAAPVKETKTETPAEVIPKTVVTEKPVVTTPIAEVKSTVSTAEDKYKDGGFFKKTYSAQSANKENLKTEKGTAAVFKSTSGWDDGKYYCLYNTAPAGTIIKITSNSNQKFIYAKVLDVIPDLQQNEGILIRLSNAAKTELGAATDSFDVILNY